jgi:quercetin dioxygenase-like cupin family protein
MELQLVRFTDLRPFELAPGISARPLFGEGAMINLIEFEPGSVVPLHSHPHEQLGICLRGLQVLVIEGVEHEFRPMDGYVVPGGMEHSAYCGPDGATVIDVFQPVREDYLSRYRSEAP